jgi:hypothetical protein
MQVSRSTYFSTGESMRRPLWRLRISRSVCRYAATLLIAMSCGWPISAGAASVASGDLNPDHIPTTGPVHLQAHDVVFQVIDDVQIQVKSMDGLLLPTRSGHPVSIEEPTSMRIEVQSAQASLSAEALSRLLNQYTLPHAKSDVRDLNVSFEDGHVQISGKLKKLVEIPFSATGDVDVTHDGDVRVHLTHITAAGFVHKKMLDFFGLKVAEVAGPGKPHSFRVVGDDVIFPIHTLFPPPHFTGRLRSIKVEGDELIQIFGTPRAFAPAPLPAEHYIYFRGGVMQCGRMTMQGVDLELLNKDAGKPLTFSIEHVYEETLSGYLKNLPNHGMVAYISSYQEGSVRAE